MNKKFYEDLEKKFSVIYPSNNSAKYLSDMNYSLESSTSYQRWYRYKEGFSISMVCRLIEKYNKYPDGIILDPFMGSGSTLLAANSLGLPAVGFEINPFSFFLAKCKLTNYSQNDIKEFQNIISKFNAINFESYQYILPMLSFSGNVFDHDIEKYYMGIKSYIEQVDCSVNIKNLLKLGWLSNLENVSKYRKAGNGLKLKKYVKPRIITKQDVLNDLLNVYNIMLEDLKNTSFIKDAKLINDTCLNIKNYIDKNSISGIIFSPPYANCFDYTEIYKLELWFGDYVKDYIDLKSLRKKSLRSNLSSDLKNLHNFLTTDTLQILLNDIANENLWDDKIPTMLKLYFSDMFNNISDCYEVLKKDGFCCVVVGNSAYGGVVFPTDLIIAEFAKSIGFEVDCINIGRFIIPSSQQYNKTKELKNYLRESIICLKKK